MTTALAVGVFDGVHVGHRRVLDALRAAGTPRVVTFDPHPVPGTRLLSSVRRRVELLRAVAIEDVVVASPHAAVDYGDAVLVTGADRAEGASAREVRAVPIVEGVSSQRIRQLVAAHELDAAARLLGRPFEVEGTVVEGAGRGRGLGIPTANLDVPPNLLVPPYGIYAGAALGRRAAVSIGVNPQYGGRERKVEAFLLDFDEDLYGRRLVVELWQWLRDEAAFESEQALVDQITRDVEATRRAERPAGG
jgi:riboflavin kinase/FMN adenylyltransferase